MLEKANLIETENDQTLDKLITLEGIVEIYRSQTDKTKFPKTNMSKMVNRIIGTIIHNFKRIYLSAYPESVDDWSTIEIFKDFISIFFILYTYFIFNFSKHKKGVFTKRFVRDFWSKLYLIVFAYPKTIVLITQNVVPTLEFKKKLEAVNIVYDDIEWEIELMHDCYFKLVDGKWKRFYQ
jgi:hypothetical protein